MKEIKENCREAYIDDLKKIYGELVALAKRWGAHMTEEEALSPEDLEKRIAVLACNLSRYRHYQVYGELPKAQAEVNRRAKQLLSRVIEKVWAHDESA